MILSPVRPGMAYRRCMRGGEGDDRLCCESFTTRYCNDGKLNFRRMTEWSVLGANALLPQVLVNTKAGDGIRTHDIHVGNVTLYH